MIHYPIIDDLSKLKVSILHEETNEIGKNILLDATHLDYGICDVTNIVLEILMYTQIFILVKGALFLKGIQRSILIIK